MIKKGHYRLIAFSSTHNQFLFRLTEDGLINRNYDILFEGVFFMKLEMGKSFYLIGLEEDKMKIDCPDLPVGCKIIRLDTESQSGYIGCRRVLIQENALQPLESSIPSDREKSLTNEDIMNIYNQVKEQGYDGVKNFIELKNWKVLV